MIRPAREEILVYLAKYPHSEGKDLIGLPPKLFLELEGTYSFVCDLFANGFPKEQTKDTVAHGIRWVEFSTMQEHVPTTHGLIPRLYEEYKEQRIRMANPKTQEDMEIVLSEVASLTPHEDRPNKAILSEIWEEEHEGKLYGIKTGIPILDQYTLGLKAGHLWVVGGYTNVGKSMFMNDIVLNTAQEHDTMIFSLEMPRKDILHRLLREARCRLGDEGRALDLVNSLSLDIQDRKTSLSSILSTLQMRGRLPKVVWIDFIQNVYTPDRTEYERMTNIARDLQAFARERGVCIVAISQISNEAANSPTKTAGYKGSGAIEAACDVGIVLSRDKEETTDHVEFMLNVKKNRHGRTAKTGYQFDKDRGHIIYSPIG